MQHNPSLNDAANAASLKASKASITALTEAVLAADLSVAFCSAALQEVQGWQQAEEQSPKKRAWLLRQLAAEAEAAQAALSAAVTVQSEAVHQRDAMVRLTGGQGVRPNARKGLDELGAGPRSAAAAARPHVAPSFPPSPPSSQVVAFALEAQAKAYADIDLSWHRLTMDASEAVDDRKQVRGPLCDGWEGRGMVAPEAIAVSLRRSRCCRMWRGALL